MVKFTPRQLSVDRRIRKGPGHKRQFALCALRIFFLNLCSHDKLHKFKPDNLGDLLREQRIFLTNSAVSTKRTFAVTCSPALLAMYLSVLILLSYSWDLRDCNV